jgi:hypothetical protein
MKYLLFATLPIFATVAACSDAHQPTLNCELSHVRAGSSQSTKRRITATLTEFSEEGVWKFEGEIATDDSSDAASPITGRFFQYNEDKFDLVASTDRERITVMPDNEFLKERAIQGVTMPIGGHVSTGTPLSASCQTSLPSVGNQRYEVPEKR